jgi:hypothetical protein
LEKRRYYLMQALDSEPNGMRSCMLTGIQPVGALGKADVDITAQLTEVESDELRLVQEALERTKGEGYGKCQDCGQEIPAKRLNALPHTPCCIACQRERESEIFCAVAKKGDDGE